MIYFFISLYSFRTLFINTNSSRLITESIKALEIKTFMLFDLDFANTILSCFFPLIIGLYFLITAAIAQIFNPILKLVILIGLPIKEAIAETEIHQVTAEAKIRKC